MIFANGLTMLLIYDRLVFPSINLFVCKLERSTWLDRAKYIKWQFYFKSLISLRSATEIILDL